MIQKDSTDIPSINFWRVSALAECEEPLQMVINNVMNCCLSPASDFLHLIVGADVSEDFLAAACVQIQACSTRNGFWSTSLEHDVVCDAFAFQECCEGQSRWASTDYGDGRGQSRMTPHFI